MRGHLSGTTPDWILNHARIGLTRPGMSLCSVGIPLGHVGIHQDLVGIPWIPQSDGMIRERIQNQICEGRGTSDCRYDLLQHLKIKKHIRVINTLPE